MRQMIYSYALSYDYILVQKPRAYRVANLLLSCQQILAETQLLFYSLNAFEIRIDGLVAPVPKKTSSKSGTPQQINDEGSNATPATPFPNVHLMRQISLYLEATPETKRSLLVSHLRAFLEQIWAGRVEVLLIEIIQHQNAYNGIAFLTEFS